MERVYYKDMIRQVMKMERHDHGTLGEQMGLSRNTVTNTLSDRCGMTMENFLRYCEALDIKLFAEWEDPSGRKAKVRFLVE